MLSRLESSAYRDRLQAIWDLSPGRYTALAVVLMIDALRNTMVELRTDIGVGTWPLDQSQISKSLRGWDKDFSEWSSRVDSYISEIPPCWGDGDCWDQPPLTMVEYIERYAIGPILDAVWPDDWYLDVPKGTPMPDAVLGASLWNQLIEVKDVKDHISPMTDWLLYVEQELSSSAPGEEKTLKDKVTGSLDSVKETFEDAANKVGRGIVIGVSVGAAIIGGVLIWKAVRK